MFFAPAILSLSRRKDCQLFLLCLSKGNYEKKGHLRRAELWSSCRVLEMRPENVVMCNVTELQDDPAVEWKAQTISRIIQKYVSSLGIQALITFDQDGVSRHSNHCHIYYAVASLFLTKSIKESGGILLLQYVLDVTQFNSDFIPSQTVDCSPWRRSMFSASICLSLTCQPHCSSPPTGK